MEFGEAALGGAGICFCKGPDGCGTCPCDIGGFAR